MTFSDTSAMLALLSSTDMASVALPCAASTDFRKSSVAAPPLMPRIAPAASRTERSVVNTSTGKSMPSRSAAAAASGSIFAMRARSRTACRDDRPPFCAVASKVCTSCMSGPGAGGRVTGGSIRAAAPVSPGSGAARARRAGMFWKAFGDPPKASGIAITSRAKRCALFGFMPAATAKSAAPPIKNPVAPDRPDRAESPMFGR